LWTGDTTNCPPMRSISAAALQKSAASQANAQIWSCHMAAAEAVNVRLVCGEMSATVRCRLPEEAAVMVDVPQTLPSLLAFCGVIRWADVVSRAVLVGYAPRGASLTLTTQSRSDKPHRVPPVRQVQLDDHCGPQCRLRRDGWSCATAATFMSYYCRPRNLRTTVRVFRRPGRSRLRQVLPGGIPTHVYVKSYFQIGST
jgi:hypothetical protein